MPEAIDVPETVDPERKKLLLEQRRRLFDSIIHSNDNLDKRMTSILQSGSIIIGFVSIFKFSTLSVSGISDAIASGDIREILAQAFLLGLFFVFFIMVIMSIRYLRPLEKEVSGVTDWDKTRSDYLLNENYYYQIISDLHSSINSHKKLNTYKANGADNLGYLLTIQVGLLVFTLMLA